MTPEKQRIAIAGACGVPTKDVCQACQGEWRTHGCETCDQDGMVDTDPPDYLNDLNAMHEAENKALRDGYSYWKFIELLDGLVKHGEHVDYVADRASATAAQRGKALLHALNLWIED